MAISNHERVGRALNLLRDGLYPFIEREMKANYGDRWLLPASACLPDSYVAHKEVEDVLTEDISALLVVMWEQWNNVFRNTLGRSERSIVSELRETRNQWAHSNSFKTDDAYRALDSITRLLSAISAPEADKVEKHKQELLRLRFEEQARQETRRPAVAPTEGQPQAGLKPWREIATPHPDVARGSFQQAEFAADLWQVYLDEGSDEYRDPGEFYRRTYLTEGLKQLLSNALLRLSGKGGDPVIELQTNFGGGKTHAMLALYHLCQARLISDIPGTEPIFQATQLKEPPQNVNIAVLVGNKLQPSGITPYKPEHKKQKRPGIKTLWGELAWQLGGAEGYQLVRKADETSTNPGDALKVLFNRFSPCLILIDEWVSYARQLHEQSDMASGSFDTQFTFAQTLSESAKNARDTLLVVSIPSSDIEKGGEKGHEATERLKHAIGRVESPWQPATAEESFEIVRRRLFLQTRDPEKLVHRDAVVRAFSDMYRTQSQEFPIKCKERKYEQRMEDAYPIHPELFDRLYSDWSSLEKFQRTRGVLRLMARVIHNLWERDNTSLLIMPAHIVMDDPRVQSELTRYLEDNWTPIIEKDVDGSNSLPRAIDSENPNLGRYSACRRVARTIYMGSAPTLRGANRGLEDNQIKLGCVQPGESAATFGDALRRLTDRATYLYLDGNRYWVSTQPNVNRTAQERAHQFLDEKERHKIEKEISDGLKKDKSKGEFSRVHIAPKESADIPDDPSLGVRLVVINPQYPHISNSNDSPARQWAEDVLNHKGNSQRYHKNTLLFLAPDNSKIENLERNVAQYLAWKSIVNDKEVLNLDAFQEKQATTKCQQSSLDVDRIRQETYQWLLVPSQPDPQGPIEWKETRLLGQESPIERSSKKAVYEGDLLDECAASILRMEALDSFLWSDSNHISLLRLWECLTQYPYLPRLKNQNVLLAAIRKGVATNDFAYAEEFKDRYIGLKAGTEIDPTISNESLLVKPAIAQKQLDAEVVPQEKAIASRGKTTGAVREAKAKNSPSSSDRSLEEQGVGATPVLRRFYGNIEIDAVRVNRDVPAIANEVIQHLTSLNGSNVKVTLEIEAEIPDFSGTVGFPDEIVRTVTENCRTLKFKTQEFEE